jgi:hypothetical protein
MNYQEGPLSHTAEIVIYIPVRTKRRRPTKISIHISRTRNTSNEMKHKTNNIFHFFFHKLIKPNKPRERDKQQILFSFFNKLLQPLQTVVVSQYFADSSFLLVAMLLQHECQPTFPPYSLGCPAKKHNMLSIRIGVE